MERIYDKLDNIESLWKKLDLTKPNSREYDAVIRQIRALSDEYMALIDAPKKPLESK